MNVINRINRKWLITGILLVIAILILLTWHFMPCSNKDMKNSLVMIEHRYYYVLNNNGKPLLYFNGIDKDTSFIKLSENKKIAIEYTAGCWINRYPLIPSCNGCIATSIESEDTTVCSMKTIKKLLKKEIDSCIKELEDLEHAHKEVNYYLDSHDVRDNGFEMAARYSLKLTNEKNRITKIIAKLKSVAKSKKLSIDKVESCYADYVDTANVLSRKKCHHAVKQVKDGLAILQVEGNATPEGVFPVYLWHPLPLLSSKAPVFVLGKTFVNNDDMRNKKTEIIPDYIEYDSLRMFPPINVSNGSPVFTQGGIFLGITEDGKVIDRKKIRRVL